MAEVREISLRFLPTRSLRKKVRSFIRGDEVSVIDSYGRSFSVGIQKDKLVLTTEEALYTHTDDGECGGQF